MGYETVSNFAAQARETILPTYDRLPISARTQRPVIKDRLVFESNRMSRKNAGGNGKRDRPAGDRPDDPSGWIPPKLAKLEPGTAEHERARIAFELLRAARDDFGHGGQVPH